MATWTAGRVSATVQGRYIDKGVYDVTLVGPQDAAYNPSKPKSVNDKRVSSRVYVDLSGQAHVKAGARRPQLDDFVNNLFDKDPPIAPGAFATSPVLFDVPGRSYRVGLRFNY